MHMLAQSSFEIIGYADIETTITKAAKNVDVPHE